MKKIISILLSFIVVIGLVGCGKSDALQSSEQLPKTRKFTDSTGRVVELPTEITSVAITGPLAQMVVFAIAPDSLVGISAEWDKSAEKYFDSKYYNLPILGQLYGGKGELNPEELLNANPQVVIDVGESKKTIVEDMDNLSTQIGIPFVHINATLSSMDETYRLLGELLGKEKEALVLSDYCKKTYETALGISQNAEKANLLYITGAKGLNAVAKDSFHGEIIDLLANNLAVVDEPSSKGTGNEVDMEQILNWNPDHIIFAPDSIYHTVKDDVIWQEINAIKNNNYYLVPNEPYNWMGFPPSVQRLLGMMWMADTLYPDATEYDLYEETKEYFKLFYHCDLTIEDFNTLVGDN